MIFDYFFFKYYNVILKSGIPDFPRFYTSFGLGVFIHINLFTIDTLLAKLDILPSIYNKTTIIISIILITTIIFIIYKNSRVEAIKIKFTAEEFKPKKKTLNIICVLYLVFTIVTVISVAFYKPSYLPRMWE